MVQTKQGVYARYIKRILDVLLSGCALVVLSPMLLIVAVLVRTKLGSPVIFCQERPGKDEKIFKMYKFRSMTDERNENGELLPDDVRLTHFGRVLRSTSLDELPELWNIFKGDMSIVGPRPLLVRDMVFMTPEQRRRHTVIPGTGPGQWPQRHLVGGKAGDRLVLYPAHHLPGRCKNRFPNGEKSVLPGGYFRRRHGHCRGSGRLFAPHESGIC